MCSYAQHLFVIYYYNTILPISAFKRPLYFYLVLFVFECHALKNDAAAIETSLIYAYR